MNEINNGAIMKISTVKSATNHTRERCSSFKNIIRLKNLKF